MARTGANDNLIGGSVFVTILNYAHVRRTQAVA